MKMANSTTNKEQILDAIGIGSVVVDELLLLEKYPDADSKTDALDFIRQVGGPVPTAIRTLSRLGKKTAFIGKIGDDYKASFILEELAKSKVDTAGMITEKGALSGFAQAWIDKTDNTRTIVHCNRSLSPFKLAEFDIEKMPQARLLHIDGREHNVIKKIISYYRHNKTVISIDTGSFREKTLELLPLADIIIMPLQFAATHLGEGSLEKLAEKCYNKFSPEKKVIITDGQNGSICTHNGKKYRQKAFKIEVQDTAGAGDVHAGGILYGILHNLTLEETLKIGAATAALKCLKMGNKEALPTAASLNIFLRQKNSTPH